MTEPSAQIVVVVDNSVPMAPHLSRLVEHYLKPLMKQIVGPQPPLSAQLRLVTVRHSPLTPFASTIEVTPSQDVAALCKKAAELPCRGGGLVFPMADALVASLGALTSNGQGNVVVHQAPSKQHLIILLASLCDPLLRGLARPQLKHKHIKEVLVNENFPKPNVSIFSPAPILLGEQRSTLETIADVAALQAAAKMASAPAGPDTALVSSVPMQQFVPVIVAAQAALAAASASSGSGSENKPKRKRSNRSRASSEKAAKTSEGTTAAAAAKETADKAAPAASSAPSANTTSVAWSGRLEMPRSQQGSPAFISVKARLSRPRDDISANKFSKTLILCDASSMDRARRVLKFAAVYTLEPSGKDDDNKRMYDNITRRLEQRQAALVCGSITRTQSCTLDIVPINHVLHALVIPIEGKFDPETSNEQVQFRTKYKEKQAAMKQDQQRKKKEQQQQQEKQMKKQQQSGQKDTVASQQQSRPQPTVSGLGNDPFVLEPRTDPLLSDAMSHHGGASSLGSLVDGDLLGQALGGNAFGGDSHYFGLDEIEQLME